MGISKVGDRYRARLYYKGTTHNIGTFDTHLKASRAINAKRKELKADEDLDRTLHEIVNEDQSLPSYTLKKPNLFQRLWRKIRGNG